jgi:hypothetical protein
LSIGLNFNIFYHFNYLKWKQVEFMIW